MKREIVAIPHLAQTKSDSGTRQRGFAILELLDAATRPLASGEIADAVPVNDSTMQTR